MLWIDSAERYCETCAGVLFLCNVSIENGLYIASGEWVLHVCFSLDIASHDVDYWDDSLWHSNTESPPLTASQYHIQVIPVMVGFAPISVYNDNDLSLQLTDALWGSPSKNWTGSSYSLSPLHFFYDLAVRTMEYISQNILDGYDVPKTMREYVFIVPVTEHNPFIRMKPHIPPCSTTQLGLSPSPSHVRLSTPYDS